MASAFLSEVPSCLNTASQSETNTLSERILARYLRKKFASFPATHKLSDAQLVAQFRAHAATLTGGTRA
jgi:hypothetical protein